MKLSNGQIVFKSELKQVGEILSGILIYTKSHFPQASDEVLKELRLIYSELLANAVVHGNKGDASKQIELFIKFEPNGIMSVIKDEGDGFDYKSTLECNSHPLSEHGRGLIIVNLLADQIGFNHCGNEITFRKILNHN